MTHPVDITDDTFDQEVIQASTPVLVDFWADWCAPCKMIAPIVNELAEEYDGRIKFTKLDVDSNPATATKSLRAGCGGKFVFRQAHDRLQDRSSLG